MKSFGYIDAGSMAGATRLLATGGGTQLLAGGTDLLTEMKLRIKEPHRIVNLKTIPGIDGILFDESNGLRIGTLATLSSLAASPAVKERYPAFHKAVLSAASPQLRNRATLGGNLNQDSRCWYYRGPFHCWLKGGNICYALNGNNYYHAIFGGGPCFTVHPSDPPVALAALGAEVLLTGARRKRTITLEKYFRIPQADARRLTVIRPDEIVTEIRIPLPPPGSSGTFLKAMDRHTWAFALVSVAVQLTLQGEFIREARVVAGGVAPLPWRLPEVENSLRDQHLNENTINRAAGYAISSARPLSHNGYKLPLLQNLLIEALLSIGNNI